MILITTADKRLWDQDEKILFLGEWCLFYDYKFEWSKLNYIIMPYPFDDRQKLYESYNYLKKLYNDLMPTVARALNRIHKTNHTSKCWEITVCYWFRTYIEVLYERYICLKYAFDNYPIKKTKVLSESSYITPNDTYHFDILYKGDFYNFQLYSQIIRYLRLSDFYEVQIEGGEKDRFSTFNWASLKLMLKEAIKWISFIPSRWNRYFLISSYFPLPLLLKISLRLRIFPLLESPKLPIKFKEKLKEMGRNEFLKCSGIDEFGSLVVKTLPENFPKIYLENYADACYFSKKYFPKKVKIIVTANAFASNDNFKIWCAHKVEEDVPYLILQHGGNYGCARWNSSEDYETKVADNYFTYGWTDKQKKNVIKFFANRLHFVGNRKMKGLQSGYILWVLASFPRYAYSMYSVPVGPQFLKYLEDQGKFLKSLCPKARRLIRCRPYMHEYGWEDLKRIKEYAGKFQIANTRVSMWKQLKKCRMFVCTFNATALLEAFVANVPTVIYWDPSYWEIRHEARDYFNALHRLGILHYDAESAANKVNLTFDYSINWWNQKNIQEVIDACCERFARTTKDSTDEWVKAITSFSRKKII